MNNSDYFERVAGKRSTFLSSKAIAVARGMLFINSRSAEWIAKDALKELGSSVIQERIAKRSKIK
ncbi:MAG: hypothetical protein ACPLYF_01925, partial [Fervidobacterium sp.]